MSRIHWQITGDPFRDFQREVGRFFESIEPLPQWRAARANPPVNLYDAGDHYVLKAPMPGLAAGDVDLSITGESLTIRGERKRSEGVAEGDYRRQERPFGRTARTVTLPDRVDGSAVTASLGDGVLTVTLPKAPEARPRQISVKGASS